MSTVRIYQSTDPAAPPHPSNVRGSMAALLRACLVTGYGNGADHKEPAGWEEPYPETNNKACFRAVEGTARQFYQVNDQDYDQDVTYCTSFDSMSSAETGEGARGAVYLGKWYDSSHSQHWAVIADERTCYVVLQSQDSYILHGFGEYHSLIDDDPCPSFIAGHNDRYHLADDAINIALHTTDWITGTEWRSGYVRHGITTTEHSSFSMLNIGSNAGYPFGWERSTPPPEGVSWLHMPVAIKALDDTNNGTACPCGLLRGLRAPLTKIGTGPGAAGSGFYLVWVDAGTSRSGCVLIQSSGSWD